MLCRAGSLSGLPGAKPYAGTPSSRTNRESVKPPLIVGTTAAGRPSTRPSTSDSAAIHSGSAGDAFATAVQSIRTSASGRRARTRSSTTAGPWCGRARTSQVSRQTSGTLFDLTPPEMSVGVISIRETCRQ